MPVNYSDAQQQCVNKGAHLVSINSVFEQSFVLSKLGTKKSIWIGLNDRTDEGNYVWTDQSAVV